MKSKINKKVRLIKNDRTNEVGNKYYANSNLNEIGTIVDEYVDLFILDVKNYRKAWYKEDCEFINKNENDI